MHRGSSTEERRFAINFEAIVRRDHELAERLALPVGTDHLGRDAEGRTLRLWRGTWIDLDANAPAETGEPKRGASIRFGVGSGRALDAELARGESFTLWEPDPALLRLVLSRYDWSEAIESGRLEIVLGADLVRLARWGRTRRIVVDGATAHMRSHELRLLRGGARRPIAVFVEGRLLVDAISNALDRRGVDVYQLDVERLSREELDRALRVLAPRFAVAINEVSGVAEWTADADLPLVVWEIDPTTDEPRRLERRAPHARMYTYRRAHVEAYRRAGWSTVEHLPLAADPLARRPRHLLGPDRLRYRANVAFVGASMAEQANAHLERFAATLAKVRGERELEDDLAGLERVLTEQSKDLDRYLVPELLRRHLPAALDAWERSGATDRPDALVGEYAASLRRAAVIGAVAPFGARVWGDRGWVELLASAGVDARCYRGPAGNRDEIEKIYSGAIVNLDVGRLYQNDIATLRVFDVLACGGLCLTERNEEIESLFDVGTELDVYSNRDELLAKVAHHLDHPEHALAIGTRGRLAIQQRHSLDLRLDRLLAGIELRGSEPARAA
ncbi:MAG: glycosyltransferase [Planctomycetota bacterium]